jgi:hypothetical protein
MNFKKLQYKKITKIFEFLIILLCIHTVAVAQHSNQVFVDLNSGLSIAQNSFTDTWDPYPAGHLNVRVPFYAGQLEAGVRYTRFKGDAPSDRDSDFHSIFIHAGYSYPIQITNRYRLAPTLRFGNNQMIFDSSNIFTNQAGTEEFVTDQTESEFAYEFALRNGIRLSKHWQLNATLSYNRTLTFFPLSVTRISVGITYAFNEPEWLKDFVK